MSRNFIVSSNYGTWDDDTVVGAIGHFTVSREYVSNEDFVKDLAVAAHPDNIRIENIETVQFITDDETEEFLYELDLKMFVDLHFDLFAAVHITGQVILVIGITEVV